MTQSSAPGVPPPAVGGRDPALAPPHHGRSVAAQRKCIQPGTQPRQVEQQGRQQGAVVGRQQGQRIQGIGQHRPGGGLGVVGIVDLPALQQRLAHCGGQRGRRGSVQQAIQAGDRSAVHSIMQTR